MTLVVIVTIVVLAIFSPILVSAIILFPYIRVGVARARVLLRLKSVAQERGYIFRPLRRFPFLSLNTSRGYDFLLIGKQKILAVKLWSAVSVQCTALIKRDRTLLERTVVPEPIAAGDKQRRTVRIKKRRFPMLERNFPAQSKRPVETVILYCPKYAATYVQSENGGKNVKLELGTKLFGATLCDENTIYRFL